MARCEIHCPSRASALPAVAVAVAAVVAVVAVESVLLWLLVIVAVVCAAGTVVLVAVLRANRRTWIPAAQVKTPARVALETRTARRAIEAPKPVVYRITDLEEVRRERA